MSGPRAKVKNVRHRAHGVLGGEANPGGCAHSPPPPSNLIHPYVPGVHSCSQLPGSHTCGYEHARLVAPRSGQVLMFSACRDNQRASDAAVSGGTGEKSGAMTYAFCNIVNGGGNGAVMMTYHALLHKLRHKMLSFGMSQTLQFSSSHDFDMQSRLTL